jgi:hypothetical protein
MKSMLFLKSNDKWLLVSGIRLHKIFCLNKKLVLHKIAALSPIAFELVLDQIRNKVLAH